MKDRSIWGVIGTGGIASDFADALSRSTRCRIVNVSGSSPAKARAFGERWSLPASADLLDALLADSQVEAVYIASPHPSHEAQALACIKAGKHVLCEKPITIDAAGAERVIEAARQKGVFSMEAWMYRCHPLMRDLLLPRLREGIIGKIRHVRADFGFRFCAIPQVACSTSLLGGGGIFRRGRLSGICLAAHCRLDRRGSVRRADQARSDRSHRPHGGRRNCDGAPLCSRRGSRHKYRARSTTTWAPTR